MTNKNHLYSLVILFTLLFLISCAGGGGSPSTTSNPQSPNAQACQSPFLSQVCGTVWISGCVDQTTHYTQVTIEFNNDETFIYTGRDYSDSACTTEISSLAMSGGLIEHGDILLLDGSTGKKVDLYVTMYDGNVIDPATVQYTIFQIDPANPNILYGGDTNDTAAQRDANNRVRYSNPLYKQ